MKLENVHTRFVSSLLMSLPFFTVVVFLLIFSAQAQASGKIVIRQFANQDPNLQLPDLPGFDSQWPFADEQKKLPKQMKFFKPDYSQPKNRPVPENPIEVTSEKNKNLHYEKGFKFKDGAVLINVKQIADKKYQVMLPQPADYYTNMNPPEIFFNGEARRIVVWNGKEDETGVQLLICSDQFRSATGQSEAVLSVMPLPGRPFQIYRVSDSFECLQNAIRRKNNVNPDDLQKFPVWNGRIAPYSVQSFEISDIPDFLKKADLMIFSAYGTSARYQIRPKQFIAIQRLLDEKKYTFFAFDISWLRDRGTITEPIAYVTQSSSVRIPLLDNAIGGANEHTTTNAIIITPAQVTPKDGLGKNDNLTIIGKTVAFTVDELEKISPEIAAFCKKHKMDKVLVRQVVADGKLTEYADDINLVNVPTQTNAPNIPNNPSNQKKAPEAEQKNVPEAEQKNVSEAEQKNVSEAEQKNVPEAEQKNVPEAEQENAPEAEQKNAPEAEQKNAPEAEQKNVPQMDNTEKPAQKNVANPAEKPQDGKSEQGKNKQNPGQNKGVNPPA